MKNVWYNKNIINKIECCSVDNLQSLLSIIAAKMKSMIYQLIPKVVVNNVTMCEKQSKFFVK